MRSFVAVFGILFLLAALGIPAFLILFFIAYLIKGN